MTYKYVVKAFKLWKPITEKTIYSRDVVFREVKDVPRQEVTPMEKEPEKIGYELKNEESNSMEEAELE